MKTDISCGSIETDIQKPSEPGREQPFGDRMTGVGYNIRRNEIRNPDALRATTEWGVLGPADEQRRPVSSAVNRWNQIESTVSIALGEKS
jgi:hypothetical protein